MNLERAFAGLTSQPTPQCPSLDDVWRAAQGHAGPAEVERIAEHMAGCAACAQAWRLAAGLREPRRSATLLWRTSAIAGAFAAAAAAIGVAVLHRPADVERGPAEAAPRALVTEAPAADCVLRWTPVAHATSYEVVATLEGGAPILKTTVTSVTSLRVPAAPLAGQRQIFWRVRAYLDDGTTVESGTLALRLR